MGLGEVLPEQTLLPPAAYAAIAGASEALARLNTLRKVILLQAERGAVKAMMTLVRTPVRLVR